ncbi:hypothetical protein ANANG_G00150940 [Anguilla anguilla]|uniref:THAP-type domain-containing protein n=1 Tax=Anguilla anguilla TaxID=7936 RepID=A0A9D3M6M7_ANGAN|nr:hypothetical protein ANANG_G00150940 [Anguilla anguilla]
MPDCCAAANCNQCTDQSNIAFFRFPLDPERCKQWLDNCRRPDLEKKTPEQLHRLYKLCANHFEPSLICRHSALRTVLKDGAVPTIFDFTSHLNNPQSRNRKRVRESTAEELEAAKKTKDESPPAVAEEEMGENLEPQVKEDTAISKAKETLKLYFKETLAVTGFSISSSTNPNAIEPMGSHGGLSRFSPVCAEKIDQKEMLQFCEDLMGEEMRNSLRSARFFSILLQDLVNIEGKEQIPVFIRSVTVAGFPQKHLMGFLPCDVDADTLVFMLLSAIRNKWGLRMEHCRGLTYLTTGSICQKMKDLSSRILREFPQVVLAPSDPYAFNMWLIRCMPILSIQKVVNTVEEVATLLRSSSTLWGKVEAKITSLYGHMKGEVDRIKDACQNHWEYGIDAFQTMLDILEPLLCCINEINANDMDIVEQVARLRPVLMDFSFIITLVVLKNTLCCVSILNPSLKGTISISSTLQYTISNALKLLNKQLQEIAIFHRRWFSDAVCKAKKLGVGITLPETSEGKSKEEIAQCSPEDFYREMLSTQILQYLIEEVKKVFSTEMVRILRWLSLVPSYMADHNFSIRRDKVADANLNNLARPDSFYDELGCWEVKWKHASKRRILPTTVFGTLKIPDIGFYPNVQSLLKVLGTIPCVNAEADVYGQYDMVLDRYHSYLRATPEDQRLCNMAFVFVNQDVHFSVDDMVESFIQKHPDILQLLLMEDNLNKAQLAASEGAENYLKEEIEDTKIMTFEVEEEKTVRDHLKCAEPDKESLKAALQAALTVACRSQNNQPVEAGVQGGEMEFVDSFDVMRLELMGFIEADLDCDAMSERLHHIITEEWNLDLNYCRGQAYLGELSAGLQKDHFSAASQLCQISGIVATLNRVKTNIKVFHQNWFDEACALAQNLSVQIKVPENAPIPRDGMLKPAIYYKDALSVPLVDSLINAVKDHFSDDHKEALNFLSLVPCSVTVSYMFEILKSKPPLYSSDLPDPDNFFTELCCWRVKWKTKVVTVTIPDTIFQTLRLPLMQYFGNINTLLRIMCVLPSTALEQCGETMRHKLFQDYLRETLSKERSSCLAMLKVGINFTRDLDRMVAQCLKVTPKALEGLCLDKESKSLVKHAETHMEGEYLKEGLEDSEMEHSTEEKKDPLLNTVDANGHSGDNQHSLEVVFKQAALLARKNCLFSELSKEDQDLLVQDLGMCHWAERDDHCSSGIEEKDILDGLVKSIRHAILSEAQESPFFSLITDKVVTVADKKYLPTFIRYVASCVPKVELLGFIPFDDGCDSDAQSKSFEAVLTEDWGLQMNFCRGQAYMRVGTEGLCLKSMSLNILERYPQAVNTPSESCGLAYWLVASLPCAPVTRVLEIVEDLVIFFDQSPRLEGELAQAVDVLLNTPREALAEIPETCCSRWKKREDFFDILVDTLEGVLSCLDSVSSNASGVWNSTMSLHAGILSQAVREADFVVALVILKNVCAPLRNCSTVFRCGNPADIICEVDKMTPIIESLSNVLENINMVHSPWFEEATQLATKVASGQVCFPEKSSSYESPEAYYRETLSKPVLSLLMEELKHNFSESHLNALKVLSLLPTCNTQAVDSEFTEKLLSVYQTDLPEPDSAEQDICNWASFWKEKCQEVSPPASISETLLHPKSQDHSTVSTLLKIAAVLPSVSMECDLMKTTLNSMRDFLKSCVCKNNKMDIVMVHMHHTAIQALEDVLDKCIDVDPDRSTFLHQVQRTVEILKLESEAENEIVHENSSAVSQELSGMQSALINTVEELQTGEQKSGESGHSVMSFYSPSVREEILKELWDSQFFSVITEQVTDIEGERYIPVTVRYLDKQDTQCEESVALVPYCEDPTAFADTIETVLSEKWGLNMEFCRGQSVLSTGSVGSHMRAVSAIISQKYSLATRTISSSVSLNMWLAKSSPVPGITHSVATMEKMLLWFANNVELWAMLEDKITLMFPQDDSKGIELKDRLTSDWGKSHDMFEVIAELLEAVTLTLYEIARRQTSDSHQNQARVFSSAVSDFEFVFSVIALKNITGLTKNLSQSLQGKPLDTFSAVNCLPAILASLNEVKSNLTVHHDAWFREARSLAAKLQIRLLQPALEELLSNHYSSTVSVKAVEHSITEVTELFSDHTLSAMRCLTIVPYVLSKMEPSCMEHIVSCIYRDDLPDTGSLACELKSWNSKWKDPIAGYLPATVLDTLKVFDIRCFCNIETLLRVLVILPFSRQESTFQQGKKSLQAFMQQEKRSFTELHSL